MQLIVHFWESALHPSVVNNEPECQYNYSQTLFITKILKFLLPYNHS